MQLTFAFQAPRSETPEEVAPLVCPSRRRFAQTYVTTLRRKARAATSSRPGDHRAMREMDAYAEQYFMAEHASDAAYAAMHNMPIPLEWLVPRIRLSARVRLSR